MSELFFRTVFAEQLKIWKYPLIFKEDRLLGYRYRANTKGTICIPSISKDFRINKNGYYGPSFELEKAPGTYRIAIVDSSHGGGIWLDGNRTYAMFLDDLFRDDGYYVEVVNFSLDGEHRGLSKFRQIRYEVLNYQPDLILLNIEIPMVDAVFYRATYRGYVFEYGYSGQSWEGQQEIRRGVHGFIDRLEASWIPILYDSFYTVRAFFRWYTKGKDDLLATRIDVYQRKNPGVVFTGVEWMTPEDLLKHLRQLSKRVQEASSELYLFNYSDSQWPHGVAATFKTLGLNVLSLRMHHDPILVHEHDGHYNTRGHELVAERLYRELRAVPGLKQTWPRE